VYNKLIMTPLEWILISLALILLTGFITFAIVSLTEGHRRAAMRSAFMAALSGLLLSAALFAPPLAQTVLLAVIGAGLLVSLILLLWPGGRDAAPSPSPDFQVDERTVVFARNDLRPGTPEFNAYYAAHPEHLARDNAFRANPGLMTPGASFYDDLLVASPESSFFVDHALAIIVDGPVASEKVTRNPETLTRFVKRLAPYHGALDVGICELQPYHVYSHVGRGEGDYGAPIPLDHRYAIAFTVEMTHAMVNAGPRMPTLMESARQYVEVGRIAVTLAAAIRRLGYPARAHIEGDYQVIAPLVAKDAGLGEIGRMSLLMTPRLGPRVRLGVVTTDLPLLTDAAAFDPAMIDFCTRCRKCAEVCPSGAIPSGDREWQEDGTLRWKLNPERCFTYWTQAGTDCARCMAVCPYAHADNFFHNLIRFGVNHSSNFRKAAVRLDDAFYGKKPPPHDPPGWLQDLS